VKKKNGANKPNVIQLIKNFENKHIRQMNYNFRRLVAYCELCSWFWLEYEISVPYIGEQILYRWVRHELFRVPFDCHFQQVYVVIRNYAKQYDIVYQVIGIMVKRVPNTDGQSFKITTDKDFADDLKQTGIKLTNHVLCTFQKFFLQVSQAKRHPFEDRRCKQGIANLMLQRETLS
jgi:hypothetical protein